MNYKTKLAVEAVEKRDFISNENRRAYGEGYIEGFDKACLLAARWIKLSGSHPRYLGRTFSQAINMLGDDIHHMGDEEYAEGAAKHRRPSEGDGGGTDAAK